MRRVMILVGTIFIGFNCSCDKGVNGNTPVFFGRPACQLPRLDGKSDTCSGDVLWDNLDLSGSFGPVIMDGIPKGNCFKPAVAIFVRDDNLEEFFTFIGEQCPAEIIKQDELTYIHCSEKTRDLAVKYLKVLYTRFATIVCNTKWIGHEQELDPGTGERRPRRIVRIGSQGEPVVSDAPLSHECDFARVQYEDGQVDCVGPLRRRIDKVLEYMDVIRTASQYEAVAEILKHVQESLLNTASR